jgi:hypothetical protein
MSSATADLPHPDRVPYAVDGRVSWNDLTDRQREQVRSWLTDLGVDPARVPRDALMEYDPDTGEWRIEMQARRNGAPYLRPDGELATVVRRVQARR